jgi:hypothetical protein
MNRQERRQLKKLSSSKSVEVVAFLEALSADSLKHEVEKAREYATFLTDPLSVLTATSAEPEVVEENKKSPFKAPTKLEPGAQWLQVGTGEPLKCADNVLRAMRTDDTLYGIVGINTWVCGSVKSYEAHCVTMSGSELIDVTAQVCEADTRVHFTPMFLVRPLWYKDQQNRQVFELGDF